jgi:multidrug resistance protein, MATE family
MLEKCNSDNIKCFAARSWHIAWPMTLIMVFEALIGLTDVFVAGRLGKDIQAAYGFVVQFYFIFIVVANALTVGTVSVVSQLFTSKDKDQLTAAIFSSLTTTAGAGLIIAFIGIAFAPLLINLLNIPVQVKPFTTPLIQIYSGGLLFQYLVINTNGILRSCEQIRTSLKTMAVVCLLNIGLIFLYVFFTPLGFKGIALATATASLLGCIINLSHVKRLMTKALSFSSVLIKKVALIGWPMAAVQILWQAGSMVLFLIISELPENRVEILAALTTGLRLESVIYLPAFAFNMANAVIVGNLLGEKEQEEAYRSGMMTALIGVSVVAFMALLVIVNARWIASLLSNNTVVVRETVRYIYISMISEPFMAFGIILGGGLSGAGDTRSVMTRVAMSVWFIRLPLAYLLVVLLGFGAAAVWWSMNISQFVQCGLLYRRYAQKTWLPGFNPTPRESKT